MSAFVTVKTEFSDPDCIVEALEDLGYKPEVHKEPQTLFGYMGDARSQKAEIIVRRGQLGQASNDMGFYKDKNGKYQLWLSNFDQTAVPGRLGLKGMKGLTERLAQNYGVSKVLKSAKKNKYTAKKEKQKDGSVKVRLTAWR